MARLRIEDFDFHLPEELIAQVPLSDRSSSRMLHVSRETGALHHRHFRDLPDILESGDVLVMNNTRVTARRLLGEKVGTGGAVEALLMTPLADPYSYIALTKPAKRLQVGAKIQFENDLAAEVTGTLEGGLRALKFVPVPDFEDKIARAGEIPLPPYITSRNSTEAQYQTVYAKVPGSSAAPTAGLHFTPQILDTLRQKGVQVAEVTLDVGIDTFRPIMTDDVTAHPMHGETCEVDATTAEIVNSRRGRLVTVGTTSTRTLETFAGEDGKVTAGRTSTSIFFYPGRSFRVVDGMLTNFHMPRTTMLLMVSAMVGYEAWRESYKSAIEEKYRFLSFGDSMLLL